MKPLSEEQAAARRSKAEMQSKSRPSNRGAEQDTAVEQRCRSRRTEMQTQLCRRRRRSSAGEEDADAGGEENAAGRARKDCMDTTKPAPASFIRGYFKYPLTVTHGYPFKYPSSPRDGFYSRVPAGASIFDITGAGFSRSVHRALSIYTGLCWPQATPQYGFPKYSPYHIWTADVN
ncbi:putative dynactin subunit 1 isoform X1 [Sesbania bispinosa]|nr:putative dynactin subunit 1 isoform X1 [Sesbania bispinosa]